MYYVPKTYVPMYVFEKFKIQNSGEQLCMYFDNVCKLLVRTQLWQPVWSGTFWNSNQIVPKSPKIEPDKEIWFAHTILVIGDLAKDENLVAFIIFPKKAEIHPFLSHCRQHSVALFLLLQVIQSLMK
jgi:hypothetical protein